MSGPASLLLSGPCSESISSDYSCGKCCRCCWSLMTLFSHLFHTPDWLSLVWWLLLSLTSLEVNLGFGGERLHSSQCWGVRMGRPYTDPCQDPETLSSGLWDHWWLCSQQLVNQPQSI